MASTSGESEYDSDGYRKYNDSLGKDRYGREDFLHEHSYSLKRNYKYKALPESRIRLVTLLPGDQYSAFRCELETYQFEEAPRFEALSYHCGDAQPPAWIQVGHHLLQVTQNLKIALAYLRRKDAARLMWIDAICINQDDNTEKAREVARMRNIYERSFQTVMWVGESPPSFHANGNAPNLRAFDLCERIERCVEAVKDKNTTFSGKRDLPSWGERLTERALHYATKSEEFSYTESDYLQMYTEALQLGQDRRQSVAQAGERLREEIENESSWDTPDDSVMAVEIESLGHIVSRPYFNRVWILQEVAVAQKAILQCGPALTKFRTLATASFVLHRSTALARFGFLLANIDLSQVLTIWILRRMVQQHNAGVLPKEAEKELRIVSLVKRFRHWEATNPRDKIYALLGLALNDSFEIIPDYQRPVEETYRAFAHAVLCSTDRLDLWTGFKGRSRLHSGLPLWAPDWTDTTPQMDLLFNAGVMGFLGKKSYTGKSFAATGTTQTVRPGIFLQKFIAAGYTFAEITKLGDVIDSSKRTLECRWVGYHEPEAEDVRRSLTSVFQLTKTLRQWETISESGGKTYPPTKEPTEKAYQRILNIDLLPNICSEETASTAFRAWRNWLKIVFDTLKGLDTLKVDVGDWIKGKDVNFAMVDDMLDRLGDRLATGDGGGGGGYLGALKMWHRDGYTGKFRSATGAYLKVARGMVLHRLGKRRDLNLALVINNPLACNLEYINQRRLAKTGDGFLALVPVDAQSGDRLALLDGGAVPFVVRKRDDRWEMLGSAYVHGAMYGEMWDAAKCESMQFF